MSLVLVASTAAFPVDSLPGTGPILKKCDFALEMVDGIHRYLDRETENAIQTREQHWARDLSTVETYLCSVEPNRQRLRHILGVDGDRLPPAMEAISMLESATQEREEPPRSAQWVQWRVLPGLDGVGWFLRPEGAPHANVILLPDCDEKPESQPAGGWRTADRLAASGCNVLVPLLIDRDCTFSGNPGIRMTNQPHREFIYRAAYEMGTHVIGLEVQEVLAAVDWFAGNGLTTGVIGYGEGGLLAFYAAAVDRCIQTVAISGYFGPRENLWREPIYRNVWSLLREFGDAQMASLLYPRPLLIEASTHPPVKGPPAVEGRSGAAPGEIMTPSPEQVREEAGRAQELTQGLPPARITVTTPGGGEPWSEEFVEGFLAHLSPSAILSPPPSEPVRNAAIPEDSREKHFGAMVEYTQSLMRASPGIRGRFWADADSTSVENWVKSTRIYRDYLWGEVIGRLPEPAAPLLPRSRLVYDQPKYRGYEVILDVYPDVIAYGILLVPKDLAAGEKRPAVVCQHGLEGRPQDVADPGVDSPYYHQFACRLADKGYVTFSPQNPYIGEDRFRALQRKANPLKLSLFSFIVRQHERILEFLSGQRFIDPERIAFYGLSYGGKTAMRVPALLEGYCLSICSGDFNEWIWKNVSTESSYSYMLTPEYEMPEFGLGVSFNYSELSGVICPRPFMVERGHGDGVAPDEWVAYEYSKTKRLYDTLGIGERTEIEFFDGPHTIHGVGSFEFLDRHLRKKAP